MQYTRKRNTECVFHSCTFSFLPFKTHRYTSSVSICSNKKELIHESYPGRNIYHEDPKFLERSSGRTVLTEISLLPRNPHNYGLHSGHSACTLLENPKNRPIKVGQGPAVLTAGTGRKVFDFWRHLF